MTLAKKHCVPCEGGMPHFERAQVDEYMPKIKADWSTDGAKITREFRFKDFTETMEFVNRVAALAQAEDHHPNMAVSYSKVVIDLWTHAARGLTENDFILAAKIDELL